MNREYYQDNTESVGYNSKQFINWIQMSHTQGRHGQIKTDKQATLGRAENSYVK